MAENTDRTLGVHRLVREQQGRVTAATAIGFNVFKPIMQFQVCILRLWANNIERFADNYKSGLEETASSAVVERSKQKQAA